MISSARARTRTLRAIAIAVTAVAHVMGPAAPVSAHGPDPLLGAKLWGRDQVVGYSWDSNFVPPGWMAAAIDSGAEDVGQSRRSRAATFVRQSGAASRIAYGLTPCPSYGIACMDRTGVPDRFAGMWFKPQGWSFDWGTLKWCQYSSPAPDGCFDAENVALDEFGHIEILWHHLNYDDDRDYLDSVVQVSAHTKPHVGWNEHVFGPCDVARLQLEYDRQSSVDWVSDCLTLGTALTLTASPTSAYVGTTIAFSSVLRIAASTAAEALANDPLSGRSVLLQRRATGAGTAWTTVATMTAGSSGSYTATWSPTATYDWRATFPTPAYEGVTGSSSATIRVTVSGCSGAGCPQSVVPLQRGP